MFRIAGTCRCWAGVLLPIALVVLAGCDQSKKTASGDPDKATAPRSSQESKPLDLGPEDARRAGIKTERLELADVPETVALFGTIEPDRNRLARVLPPVDGRLSRIFATVGDQVQAGSILATLDSPELASARAAYQQSQAQLGVARTSLERTRSLVAQGSIARKEQLSAVADYEKARAALNAAAAKLAVFGSSAADPPGVGPAALAVTAPFAGTVIERTAVLGEYAQAYRPLFTIADLSSVWAETNLYEHDLGSVTVGAPATATVVAYPDARFGGRVAYISSVVDQETRTVKARVEIPNPDRRLKPGMFANVLIDKARRRPVLSVPETALVLLQGQMTAFVEKGENGGFEPRPVETGERSGGQVVVKSGLEPGDEVVVSGAYALKARLLKSQISAD